MKLSEFDFTLPESLIAQEPSKLRGDDRLMFLDKATGKTIDYKMCDLPNLIAPGTLMIFNNSKVRKARVFARKLNSNAEKESEFIFLHPAQVFNNNPITKNQDNKNPSSTCDIKLSNANQKSIDAPANNWVALVKNAKHCKIGNEYQFLDGTVAKVVDDKNNTDGALRTLNFLTPITEDWFNKVGHVPLPPYIHRADSVLDTSRYQTIYAKELGSVACPTAGLHFTSNMLEQLKARGVEIAFITLHVGLGTFLPVREDNIEDHKMHTEVYTIEQNVANLINLAKSSGRAIMAVGTTAMRTLEASGKNDGLVHSGTASTDIFIYPPYKFRIVDSLFTNFHTPQSTLLMLVSALAGRNNILNAYKSAVEKKYRFFSYGDAMLIK